VECLIWPWFPSIYSPLNDDALCARILPAVLNSEPRDSYKVLDSIDWASHFMRSTCFSPLSLLLTPFPQGSLIPHLRQGLVVLQMDLLSAPENYQKTNTNGNLQAEKTKQNARI